MASHPPPNIPQFPWPSTTSDVPMQSPEVWNPQDPLQHYQQKGTSTNNQPNNVSKSNSRKARSITNHANFDQNNLPAYTAFPAPRSLAGKSPSPYPPSFSNETQEILRRVGASPGTLQNNAAGINAGSPEWEAARQQVLKSVGSTGPGAVSPAGTPRGFADKNQILPRSVGSPMKIVSTPDAFMNGFDSGFSTAQSTTTRGRARGGRPRGRSRGSGRGRSIRRRKTGSDKADHDSDVSSDYTPTFTVTKSGRSINKPAQYQPPDPSLSTPRGTKRKRGAGSFGRPRSNGPEQVLCTKCGRGHSPNNNMIVFCDMCNIAYHQWCHDPIIGKEIVEVPEREWLCGECAAKREIEEVPKEKRVSKEVEDLNPQEQAEYIRMLPSSVVASLLIDACAMHPSIPIFAPNTRFLLREQNKPPDDGQQPQTQPQSDSRAQQSTFSRHSTPLSPAPSSTNKSPRPASHKPTPPTTGSGTRTGKQNHNHKVEHDSSSDEASSDHAFIHPRNIHPPTYPKPGHGPIKPTPLTNAEDAPWLIDEGLEAFSHLYDGAGGGSGGFVAEVGSQAASVRPSIAEGMGVGMLDRNGGSVDATKLFVAGVNMGLGVDIGEPKEKENGKENT